MSGNSNDRATERRNERWEAGVATRTAGTAAAGYLTIVLFAGSFGVWAATAPLSGAAVASGVVAAAGQNVLIQHLEGGIIREALVREGQRVEAGESVLVLDSTVAEAELNRRIGQLIALRAQSWRLEAESLDAADMAVAQGEDMAGYEDLLAATVVEQRREFLARASRYRTEQDILAQRIEALQDLKLGLEAQKETVAAQIAIVEDELARKKHLLDQGLAHRSEYAALLRSEAELDGEMAAVGVQIANSAARIVEARQEIEKQTTARMEHALAELNGVRAAIADMEEQVRAARSVLARTTVTAPVNGVVVRTLYTVPGSVIRSGEAVLELLPTSHELIVETQLQPQDIDKAQIGQQARMRFVALNTRTTPDVAGTLFYVSADRQIDQKTGLPYYVARLRLDKELPPEIRPDQVYPGMPVEVFISTGERSFVEYLLRPLVDSFSRAFREM